MSIDELKKTARNLEDMIAHAAPERRIALQPQFSRVLDRLRSQGQQVPTRMRDLDAALVDEVIEARFDNMPI